MNLLRTMGWKSLSLCTLVLVAVAACTMTIHTQHGESVVDIEIVVGGIPKDSQPVDIGVEIEIPGKGKVKVNTYDMDGDGKAETVGPVDGKYYKVDPIEPKSLTVGGGGLTFQVARKSNLPKYVVYDNPITAPATPLSVTFTKTALEYLQDYGLDQIGDQIQGVNLLELKGAWTNPDLPSGVGLDFVLHWNSEAGWVDIEQFPSLQYEDFGLPNTPGTAPWYTIRHVAGDMGAVFNWLGEHGIKKVTLLDLDLVIPDQPAVHYDQVIVTISPAAGAAVIDADGTLYTIPLVF